MSSAAAGGGHPGDADIEQHLTVAVPDPVQRGRFVVQHVQILAAGYDKRPPRLGERADLPEVTLVEQDEWSVSAQPELEWLRPLGVTANHRNSSARNCLGGLFEGLSVTRPPAFARTLLLVTIGQRRSLKRKRSTR